MQRTDRVGFTMDRGVSPVIGVILMVAITVILAAVIATFVMNMGPGTGGPPNVQWDWDYEQKPSGNDVVTLSHTGGEPAAAEDFVITVENDDGVQVGKLDLGTLASSGRLTAGDAVPFDANSPAVSGGVPPNLETYTVTLLWQNPNNDRTQRIDTYEP